MALVDPSIIMSYRGVELPNQLAQYAQVQQIQNAQNQNRLADAQMAEYQRAQAEEEGLRNYLASADLANPETRSGLTQFGKSGLAYGKALTERDTAELTQQKTRLEVQERKRAFMSQALRDISGNPSDANITAYLEDLAANPLFSDDEKASVTSTASRLLAMPIGERGAFMASQGAAPAAAAKETPNLANRYKPVGRMVFDTETGQYIEPPATPGAAPAAAAPAPAGVGQKAPSGYRFTPSGDLEPIPGGPATRSNAPKESASNVTEQQASTATQRLLRRAQEISEVLSANKNAEAPTAIEAGMENIPFISRAANLARSTDRQIVSSAQDDILDALLYLSTGAAYNKEQLAQQKSAYLPSWSDDPRTRQVKRQRLMQAIEGARVRAGRAWSPELDAAMTKLFASPVMNAAAPAAKPSLDSIFGPK